MQSWIISMLMSFVLRQLEKFKDSIDWEKLEADLDVRVRKLVPGTWFDDEAVTIVSAALNTIKGVLSERDNIKRLVELLMAQKYDEAFKILKDILFAHLSLADVSYTPAEVKLKGLLAQL